MKKPFSIERRHDELAAAEMMARPDVAQAVNESLAELKRAENIYQEWPHDPIHQVAIMMEEAGEAMREANDMREIGADVGPALHNEMVQIIRCLINRKGVSGLARKVYPICGCNGDWVDQFDATFILKPYAYMCGSGFQENSCQRCHMYPWGTAYNDNMMRDLQEMNR